MGDIEVHLCLIIFSNAFFFKPVWKKQIVVPVVNVTLC